MLGLLGKHSQAVPGYRFQLFYWDYVVGLFLGALLWGLSLGSFGGAGRPFIADVLHADSAYRLLAFTGGVIFNVANLLLVAAIDIAGLAVAFPVGIGLALVIGAVSNYAIQPQRQSVATFRRHCSRAGRNRLRCSGLQAARGQQQSVSKRGVVLSLASGLLMGTFYPFVAKSMEGTKAPGPYAATLFFAIGVVTCAIPVNALLMRKPLDGREPVSVAGFTGAPLRWHAWGLLGGLIWCTGAVLNFVASRAHVVGPAVSYSVGQGATMVSACWGVFIWHEFADAPPAIAEIASVDVSFLYIWFGCDRSRPCFLILVRCGFS